MSEKEYIKIGSETLPINELPLVIDEPIEHKLGKAVIFYSVVIVILCLLIWISWISRPVEKKCKIKKLLGTTSDKIKMTSFDIYCQYEPIKIDNIILNTTDQNIIDIDIITNEHVEIIKFKNGLLYSFDFGFELEVENITIISDEYKYIKHINIDLFNDGKKVWEYKDILPYQRENTILISTPNIMPLLPYSVDTINLNNGMPSHNLEEYDDKKMADKGKYIINDKYLQIQLSEDSEKYTNF